MESFLSLPLETRQKKFKEFTSKFPQNIPVFIDVAPSANAKENKHVLKKNKFLFSKLKKIKIKDAQGNVLLNEDGTEKYQETVMTIGDMMATTRAYMLPDAKGNKLTKEESLFFFVHGNNPMMLAADMPVVEAMQRYAAEDGFLYIVYSTETVMGC
jgi:hypothetical protein